MGRVPPGGDPVTEEDLTTAIYLLGVITGAAIVLAAVLLASGIRALLRDRADREQDAYDRQFDQITRGLDA